MKRVDYLNIGVLIAIVLVIFYPVYSYTYVYTDEIVQLWFYGKRPGFQMFAPQGRNLTEFLFQWLFGSIQYIRQLTALRLFSLVGWLVCIPIWYYVLKRIVTKEGLPQQFTFFSMVYLICMPAFGIYVSWAACLQLFIANTAGLISGYILYENIRIKDDRVQVSTWAGVRAIIVGCVSLFSYQSGFACFLLPFFIQFIFHKRLHRSLVIGLCFYLLIYVIYYLIFKQTQKIGNVPIDERTSLYLNPINKLKFVLGRVLAGPFHFTYLFNEKKPIGYIVYLLMAGIWMALAFYRHKTILLTKKFQFLLALAAFALLFYIPSLIVKENYASNRTLFALNMGVFFLFFETVLFFLNGAKARRTCIVIVCVLFLVNAWYNHHQLMMKPLLKEYKAMRAYIETNCTPNIHKVYFIRPEEDLFERKYGITRSWDEFGVPSGFFNWVPECLVKQVVFEKTGSRQTAERLTVKSWLGTAAYAKAHAPLAADVLVIDEEAILSN